MSDTDGGYAYLPPGVRLRLVHGEGQGWKGAPDWSVDDHIAEADRLFDDADLPDGEDWPSPGGTDLLRAWWHLGKAMTKSYKEDGS